MIIQTKAEINGEVEITVRRMLVSITKILNDSQK